MNCTCRVISSRQVVDGECLICGKPVAEPASPAATPETEPISEGGNLSSMAYRAATREENGAPQSGAGGEHAEPWPIIYGVRGHYGSNAAFFNKEAANRFINEREKPEQYLITEYVPRPSSPSGQAAATAQGKYKKDETDQWYEVCGVNLRPVYTRDVPQIYLQLAEQTKK